MARLSYKMMARLKMGISTVGMLIFLAGVVWLWQMRNVWPRSASDPVPQRLLVALGVIISGLYVVNRAR